MKKFLILSGNESGVNILDHLDLEFLPQDKADEKFEFFLEEYDSAVMYEILDDKMVLIKEENNFF